MKAPEDLKMKISLCIITVAKMLSVVKLCQQQETQAQNAGVKKAAIFLRTPQNSKNMKHIMGVVSFHD